MKHAALEEALTFDCAGEQLIGVLHGADTTADTAVVVIVGGPQYRAGSHRQFVQLGRALAAAGYPTLRFDYRGMGDSTGEARDFEHVSDDIASAIDALMQRMPQVRQVVLWGLCDGASAALLYCGEHTDPRIAGLCLVNPWVRSEATLARTHVKHYYAQRLLQPEFWKKLLRGQVGTQAVRGLARNAILARQAPATSRAYPERMASAWRGFAGALHLVLSENDYTAKEFLQYVTHSPAWHGALEQVRVRRTDVPGADHTFSNIPGVSLPTLTTEWLTGLRDNSRRAPTTTRVHERLR